jgi:ABC-type uncharacterized transport system permease subunit
VEIMTGAHGRAQIPGLLAASAAWVLAFAVATAVLWRRGVRTFEAYGG